MANVNISPIMKVYLSSVVIIMANVKISPIMKVYLSSVVIPSWQT